MFYLWKQGKQFQITFNFRGNKMSNNNLEHQLARVRNILQDNFCEIDGRTFYVDEIFDIRAIWKPRHYMTVADFPDAMPADNVETPQAEVEAIAQIDNLENPDERFFILLTPSSYYSQEEYLGDVTPIG